jgi:hypothetical protein
VEVRGELVERGVHPELDRRERRGLVLDDVVEDRRVRRLLARELLVVAVEGVEPGDDGLAVLLAGVRSRVRREPRLVFVEVQYGGELRCKLTGLVVLDLRHVAVALALECATARDRGRTGAGECAKDRPPAQ